MKGPSTVESTRREALEIGTLIIKYTRALREADLYAKKLRQLGVDCPVVSRFHGAEKPFYHGAMRLDI